MCRKLRGEQWGSEGGVLKKRSPKMGDTVRGRPE